ncbi:MAG: hypothetical protein IJG35_04375 [Bacteroidales bacterium]|nr:hypothetical protein [Bacteroidales bacterium]
MGVKERFIKETLESQGQRMLRAQGQAMEEALRFHTRETYGRRRIAVTEGGELSGTLTFTHTVQERFLDLKRLRHGSTESKRPKSRQIHNRFVMGTYNAIARELMYGFTEDVAARIRSEMEQAGA